MPLSDNAAPPPEFAAFIGLDWGDQKHAWSLREPAGTRIESGEVENTPEAIELWAVALAPPIAWLSVTLESSRTS